MAEDDLQDWLDLVGAQGPPRDLDREIGGALRAPESDAEADRRAKTGGADCVDWYFCQRESEEPLAAVH